MDPITIAVASAGIALMVSATGFAVKQITQAFSKGATDVIKSPGQSVVETAKGLSEAFKMFFDATPTIHIKNEVYQFGAREIREIALVSEPWLRKKRWEHKRFYSTKVLNIEAAFGIKAGFDLNRISVFVDSDGSVKVETSEPTIISVELLKETEPHYENGWWNKVSVEDHSREFNNLLNEVRLEAQKGHLKLEAEKSFLNWLRFLESKTNKPIKLMITNSGVKLNDKSLPELDINRISTLTKNVG